MIIFKLKELLVERNMTMYELSKITGIRFNTISDWCNNNDVRAITVDVLDRICIALKCNIQDIIEFVPPEE